eukprot:scaffold131138_cov30-Tisochrysis_lutea.AAC.2
MKMCVRKSGESSHGANADRLVCGLLASHNMSSNRAVNAGRAISRNGDRRDHGPRSRGPAPRQTIYQYGAGWPRAAWVTMPENASMQARPFFSSASRRAGVSSLNGSRP